MGEREDNVYKAKLAEQAERYDGKFFFLDVLNFLTNKEQISYYLEQV